MALYRRFQGRLYESHTAGLTWSPVPEREWHPAPLYPTAQQMQQANPTLYSNVMQPAWDPARDEAVRCAAKQAAATALRQAGVTVALDAAGGIVERPARSHDNRIVQALQTVCELSDRFRGIRRESGRRSSTP